MAEFDSLVVVGPSASGKDSLVQGLRSHPYFLENMFFPRRYTTRELRWDDDPQDREHLDIEDFQAAVSSGRLWPHWQRKLDIGEEGIWYGFEDVRQIPEAQNRLALYVVTNDFLSSGEESVVQVRSSAYFVMTSLKQEVRQERLKASRSWQNMPRKERHARQTEDSKVSLEDVYLTTIPTGGKIEDAALHFQGVAKWVIDYNHHYRAGIVDSVSDVYR